MFNGDPVPEDALDPGSEYDLSKWLRSHGSAETRPPIDKVIAALKEDGVTVFGAIGFCFGGRYVFDLAFDNAINAAVVCHPSYLVVPDDLEVRQWVPLDESLISKPLVRNILRFLKHLSS